MFAKRQQSRAPDFLIIGGQRCGTTSLFNGLMSHSQMAEPRAREAHYFDLNYDKGRRWYERQFRRAPGLYSGESSPYYLFHPKAASRVATDLPEVKILVLLRDPIERAWSQHQLNVKVGREDLAFLEALEAEQRRTKRAPLPNGPARFWVHRDYSYVQRSDYVRQLDHWHSVVDPATILLQRSVDLFAEPRKVHSAALAHIGLADEELETPHSHGGNLGLDAETRAAAAPFFTYTEDELYAKYAITY